MGGIDSLGMAPNKDDLIIITKLNDNAINYVIISPKEGYNMLASKTEWILGWNYLDKEV